MDIAQLVERLIADGEVDGIARNRQAQFGVATRQYLGSTFLPERDQNDTEYTEEQIRFRTVIANDGTRYSPAQLKDSGALMGTMRVSLSNSDIAREYTSRDYDGLRRLLRNGQSMEAAFSFAGWLDTMINLSLVELDEKHRWEALLNARVLRNGDNGYTETVYYSNPAGHRVTAGHAWSDPTYDPWPDIIEMVQFLYDKGYVVNRIVTSRFVRNILLANPLVAQRILATPVVLSGGTITPVMPARRLSAEQLNGALANDELPSLEVYDLQYNDQLGPHRFFDRASMFFACTTGRNEEIVIDPDQEPILLQDTLGYTGIGPAAGQDGPGRVLDLKVHTDKPPRIVVNGWETSLPVILDPEAIAVIGGIS